MAMDPIECALLLSNLSRTQEWLLPGECMPFRQYWKCCLGAFVDEASSIWQDSQIIIWVDGRPVSDPASQVPFTHGSQFAFSRGRQRLTDVLPHGAWWN